MVNQALPRNPKKKASRLQGQGGTLPYLLVAPSIGFFLVFYIYPIAYNIYLSFFEWNLISPEKAFVGLANFQNLFSESEFIEVISNSMIYMFASVFFTVVIALGLAVWLNKNKTIHTVVQALVFSPYIISFVSVSFVWMWLMDVDYGLLNYFLSLVGIDKFPWLNHPDTALFSIILVGVWKLVGYDTLVLIGGLQSIPKSIHESVSMDSRPSLRTFFSITVPMVSPTLFFLIIVNLITSAKVFETIAIMTKGGPLNSTNTLVYYIYKVAFDYFEIGSASAAGVVLFVILVIITFFYFKALSNRVNYASE